MPNKVIMICGETCTRCVFLKPHLEKRCKENDIPFEEKDIKQATQEEIGDATQLPIIWFDNETKDYDEVLSMISR